MRRVEMNRVYEKWTVLSYEGGSMYLCRCECGTEKRVNGKHLREGKSTACRTCGNSKPWTDIGQKFAYLPKQVYKKLRRAVSDAMIRCTVKTHRCYPNWGGRGIEVKFVDDIVFVEHLLTLPGYDNPTLVLDRINNDGHYESGNLRFATYLESGRNQRRPSTRRRRGATSTSK